MAPEQNHFGSEPLSSAIAATAAPFGACYFVDTFDAARRPVAALDNSKARPLDRDRLRNDVRPKAWIVIALGDEFSTYDDQTGDSYQYDSKVQNHKQVREGDLFFIRSRTGLQGAGQIKRIEMGKAQKDILRCPQCGKSLPAKALRSGGRPLRCSAGHVFGTAQVHKVDVTTYRAHFDGEWMAADKAISAIELRRFALSKSRQLSIMPADRDGLVDFVASWSSPAFRDRLRTWTGRLEPLADDEATDGPDLTPEGEDRRPAALRSIRLRRGQRDFRDALIARYNGQCGFPAVQSSVF